MKQLVEGKLKVQLDSDGEEEEDGETHAERNARIKATAQVPFFLLHPVLFPVSVQLCCSCWIQFLHSPDKQGHCEPTSIGAL